MWCVGLPTKRRCALRYWETRYNAFETSLPINEQGSYVAFSTFDACFNTVDPLYGEPWYTAKSFFRVPQKKKRCMTWKAYHSVAPFPESQVKHHWPNRALFQCFESCPRTPHFLGNGGIFAACSTRLGCCLNCENTSTAKFTCFVFILLSKMRGFALTAFLFSTAVLTVGGKTQLYWPLVARPRVCFCFGSQYTAAKTRSFLFIGDRFHFLSVIVPSDTKWQDHRSV